MQQFKLDFRLTDQPEPVKALSAIQAPPRFCPFKNDIVCDQNYPYRTYDGSCNNLKKTWLGKAEMPFKRYLQPDYADRNLIVIFIFIMLFLLIAF